MPVDANGEARVEVPINDALTAFRLVAVADAGAAKFGTGSATIRVTQDLQILAGLPPEPRKFSPHVTLAYLSGATVERVEAFASRHALFQTPNFRVERFGLYSSFTRKSAPSLYRLEAEYPLLG